MFFTKENMNEEPPGWLPVVLLSICFLILFLFTAFMGWMYIHDTLRSLLVGSLINLAVCLGVWHIFKTPPQVITRLIKKYGLKTIDNPDQSPHRFPAKRPPWWWNPHELTAPTYYYSLKEDRESSIHLLYCQESQVAYFVEYGVFL